MADKKSLGILVCGHVPTEMKAKHGDYYLKFQTLLGPDSFHYQGYFVVDNEFPESVETCDAWLITGSKHGVYEDHAWLPPLEDFVREAYAKSVPMVGICFGHQLLAQALGGTVEKFAGGWSVGRVEYSLDHSLGIETAPLHAFHQDQVIEPPTDAKPIGSTDFCRYAALSYGDKALSLQPHPEFDDEFIEDLLQYRGDILPNSIKLNAKDELGKSIESARIAETLRAFINSASAVK